MECDRKSGLGLLNWDQFFPAWNVSVVHANRGFKIDPDFLDHFDKPGLSAVVVYIDTKQIYFPNTSSNVRMTGPMKSNTIDLMSPKTKYLQNLLFDE